MEKDEVKRGVIEVIGEYLKYFELRERKSMVVKSCWNHLGIIYRTIVRWKRNL